MLQHSSWSGKISRGGIPKRAEEEIELILKHMENQNDLMMEILQRLEEKK